MGKFFCPKCNRQVSIFINNYLYNVTLFRTRERNGKINGFSNNIQKQHGKEILKVDILISKNAEKKQEDFQKKSFIP